MNNGGMAEKLVENIRRICREKNVSIMRMESDLGFSSGLISRWNKTKTCPSFDKVVDIMEYLGVTYDDIMGNIRFTNVEKEERTVDSQDKDDKVVVKLEIDSFSGNVRWERVGEIMPLELNANIVFPNMFCYDIHQAYYTTYRDACFLFSVQYNEENLVVFVAVYILAGTCKDMQKLNASEESVMKLLKVIDEKIFKRINQAQIDKIKEDFLREDFQNRYRSVS